MSYGMGVMVSMLTFFSVNAARGPAGFRLVSTDTKRERDNRAERTGLVEVVEARGVR